jgi:hypothetical protein
MNTDAVIRTEGMEALVDKLGMLEAERFVMLIRSDSFDYTKWREPLFENMTLEELSKTANEYRQNQT